MLLQDRTVLITGAASPRGLGLATAKLFAEHGAKVQISDLSAEAATAVNLASVSAQRGGGVFGGSHYSAAKAAVLGYTKAAARELGPDNIRVNAICPSYIDTDIAGSLMTPERMAQIIASVPMGRVGHAPEVAGCALFLASDLSSYVTGSEIDINGGSHIH